MRCRREHLLLLRIHVCSLPIVITCVVELLLILGVLKTRILHYHHGALLQRAIVTLGASCGRVRFDAQIGGLPIKRAPSHGSLLGVTTLIAGLRGLMLHNGVHILEVHLHPIRWSSLDATLMVRRIVYAVAATDAILRVEHLTSLPLRLISLRVLTSLAHVCHGHRSSWCHAGMSPAHVGRPRRGRHHLLLHHARASTHLIRLLLHATVHLLVLCRSDAPLRVLVLIILLLLISIHRLPGVTHHLLVIAVFIAHG